MDTEPTENVFNAEANTSLNKNMSIQQKSPTKKVLVILGLLVILLIYSAVLVALGIILNSRSKTTSLSKANQVTKLNNPNDPMFANLQGTINGMVTKIEGNKIYILSDKGGSGIFNINDPVLVSEIIGGKLVELGNSVDKIKLNEPGVIKITGYGNGYTVYSVTYLKDSAPELNAEDPIKQTSQSAKPSPTQK